MAAITLRVLGHFKNTFSADRLMQNVILKNTRVSSNENLKYFLSRNLLNTKGTQ